MTNLHIGQKIRELRREKGMTQARLAEGMITRNMLSLIESEKVNPSLETLCFLAEKLEVSPAELLAASEYTARGEGTARRSGPASRAQTAFDEGRYRDAVRILEEEGKTQEALYFSACMNEGMQLYESGHLQSARESLEKLHDTANDPFAKTCTEAFLQFLTEMTEEKSVSMNERSGASLPFLFLLMHLFSGEPEGEIARACDLFRSGYYAQAEQIFSTALSDNAVMRDPMLRLLLYRMLEACAVRLSNFEAAYTYVLEMNKLRASYRS